MAQNALAPPASEPGESATENAEAPGNQRRNLIAFLITVAIVFVVLALLPSALTSLYDEMHGQEISHVYDLFTGQPVAPSEIPATHAAFINVTVTGLDVARRVATLTVSGNRVCPASCAPVTATFYSLGSETAQRQGLPPSAAVTIPGATGAFTFPIELPIRGQPQRYPFDTYTLLLGLHATVAGPNGEQQPADSEELAQRNVSLTLEDQVPHQNMPPPVPVDPASVRAASDPTAFLLVDRLTWERPRYLRILTALLLILIAASGLLALGLRSLQELILGIGGIILGVWGVRAIVVQTPLPDITLVDALLALLILLLLLVLALRAAHYFFLQSGLRKQGH